MTRQRFAFPSKAACRLTLAIVIAGGCSDSGVGPNSDEAISIHLEEERIREAVLAVRDSISLTVRGAAAGGNAPIVWETEDAAVARIGRASGATAVVHGESFGSVRVTATSGARADTVVVTVLSPPLGGRCGEESVLELGVGQSFTTTAAASPVLCLARAAGTGMDYVIVPFNGSLTAQLTRLDISATGVAEVATDVVATRSPFPSAKGIAEGDSAEDFDRKLRSLEERDLRPLVTTGGGPRGARLALAVSPPAVGATLTLNVNPQQTCTSPVHRSARVTHVSERAVFLEDTSNPTGGFTESDYRGFGTTFDQLIYPLIRENFGEPTDIDGNGRVLVVFTRAVNELTVRDSESFVAGFFFARDLFPRETSGGLSGCASSNTAEVLYMLAPDPTGSINGNVRTRDEIAGRTSGVLAHELQHLVNASRRLRILGHSNWNEEFWLNEGLSHIAEELMFYQASGLRPRQDISIVTLRSIASGTSRFNQYMSANLGRLTNYLRDPDGISPLQGAELGTRGAAWSFLRYAADRSTSLEASVWRSLVDTDATGYTNLLRALGTSPQAWMHDWIVSTYVDNLFSVPERFRQPSWNFRSIYGSLTSTGGSYPLDVRELRAGSAGAVSAELVGGGGAILRVRVPTGNSPTIVFSSPGGPPPATIRYTVLRLR